MPTATEAPLTPAQRAALATLAEGGMTTRHRSAVWTRLMRRGLVEQSPTGIKRLTPAGREAAARC